ncbi:MAG: DJ-1/PfpI family protein [Campylobacterales bacterium]|nr:DJ-1/PfpI family protein [Campylobacterales bacterium]
MKKIVLVPLATGFEEIEAVSIIDVLRRAGIDVLVASVESKREVTGANNITILTDCSLDSIDVNELDMIVLPGGWGGTNILATDVKVQSILKSMDSSNKLIGAICAAPFALKNAGVLKDRYTCYPSVEESIKQDGYINNQKVVESHNILTSRGPATAICFGLEIVKKLVGVDKYNQLKAGLLADFC